VVKSIDEQTKAFLRAFVVDFQGKFEQVLDLAEDFRTYLSFKIHMIAIQKLSLLLPHIRKERTHQGLLAFLCGLPE
jgi:hypothetical protein